MNKQFTIKDLAEKLNLHHTTVSRALRDHPDVNKKTKKLVIDAAKKYHYIPNTFAKNLRNAKSTTIVVIVPEIKNFFFSEVLGIISNLAFEADYSVMIYQSNEEAGMESKNLDVILQNRVAGVIASVANTGYNEEKFIQLEKSGIPVVFFDRCYDSEHFSKILINNYKGAFDATDYLIRKGHKKIGFYHGYKENPVFKERHRGFINALSKHKIDKNDQYIFFGGTGLEDGIELARNFSENSTGIEALLCCVDMVALGVISGSRGLGIKIPEDLALIGFDNEPAGRIIRPSLTTVSQPVDMIGKSAFELLLTRMNDQSTQTNDKVLLDMELIKRKSA